jgi:hypothetical protein
VLAAFSVRGARPLEALARLSAASGVPFGIEWIYTDRRPVSGRWARASVAAIARGVLRRAGVAQRYSVRARGGVLQIRPSAKVRGDHSIGDVRLSHFGTGGLPGAPNNALPVMQASELLASSAAAAAFPRLHAKAGAIATTGAAEIGTCAPLFSWDGARVATILDDLIAVRCTGRQIWLILDDPSREVGGSRYWSTRNYWRGAAVVAPGAEPSLALLPRGAAQPPAPRR